MKTACRIAHLFFTFLGIVILMQPLAAYGGESDTASANTAGDQKEAVVDWFKKYDQIRRDAELSLGDKFQTMSFLDKNLDNKTTLRKRDQELVARMNAKYAQADEAMKNLQPVSATRELQDGYTKYFSQVHKIFTHYIQDQNAPEVDCTPSPSSVREQRSALEELDVANKKLDAQLRTKYSIAKHKHS